MADQMVTRMAVARLEELMPAPAYRRTVQQPLQGYCLINGDGAAMRVTIYIENGQPLMDPMGRNGFYYEAWLMGQAGPVSLGSFHVGPGGEGSATRMIETAVLRSAQPDRIRVTAEPFGAMPTGQVAVLEGRLVWLETAAEAPWAGAMASAEAEAVPEEALEPALVGTADEESRPIGFLVVSPVAEGTEAQEDAGADEEAELEAEAGAEAESEAGETDETVPEPAAADDAHQADVAADAAAENEVAVDKPEVDEPAAMYQPATGAHPQTGAEILEEQVQEAVTAGIASAVTAAPVPTRSSNPTALKVTMESRHPMAPRAGGHVILNFTQGSLNLMLRGLPSPTALGREAATDRPYNCYRVWLVNQQTHSRNPVGFLQRAWGENFRLQVESGLPLSRHDTILVTVEDRTADGASAAPPQVLVGAYSPD